MSDEKEYKCWAKNQNLTEYNTEKSFKKAYI
jgi:hypothetical protein